MMDNLLEISYNDYQHVLVLLRVKDADGEFKLWFNAVLYQLQQAFEKAFKSFLLQQGIQPKYTHNINSLYSACKSNGLAYVPKYMTMLEDLTSWEA